MGNTKNDRKMVWIYAVILFTSAFIVLLITAYSQIKFNKNIKDYENKLTSTQKEKLKIQYSVDQLVRKNLETSRSISELQATLTNLKKELENKNIESAKLLNQNQQIRNNYELLNLAEKKYEKGKYIECANLIGGEFDYFILGENAQKTYKLLSEKTFDKAARSAFLEGYRNYKTRNYYKAIQMLEISTKIQKNQYYSDDGYFFLAISNYRLNNIQQAKKYIDILINGYPKSNYMKEILELKKTIKD